MAHFFSEASRTFSEYLLLPNLTTKDCIPEKLSVVKFQGGTRTVSGDKYSACFCNHASCFGS